MANTQMWPQNETDFDENEDDVKVNPLVNELCLHSLLPSTKYGEQTVSIANNIFLLHRRPHHLDSHADIAIGGVLRLLGVIYMCSVFIIEYIDHHKSNPSY